ncbi:hypothetical protein [Streptomyces sp. NPDC006459]|uniref:hypothetical protein n=1 Tax=Streptomyces sp. NPDC006459 TaxID=3154303 RepID=UPI0033BF3B20
MAGYPGDFPPLDRVYALFRHRRDHDLVKEFHDRLRRRVREQAGRDPEPSAGVIDSQSVKADAVVGADSRGFDGRKRHVVVDTLDLLLAVMVTAAQHRLALIWLQVSPAGGACRAKDQVRRPTSCP